MVVVESALDALSYHELFPSDNSLFLSLGGRLGTGATRQIQQLLDSKQPSQVILACDRDVAGQQYHLQILLDIRWPSQREGVSLRYEAIGNQHGRMLLHVHSEQLMQQDAFLALANGLRAHGVQIEGPRPSGEGFLWSLTFPLTLELLQPLTHIVLVLRGLREQVRIHVPEGKDWNEQLCGE